LPGLTVMASAAPRSSSQPRRLDLDGGGEIGQIARHHYMVEGLDLQVGDQGGEDLGAVFLMLPSPGDSTEKALGHDVSPAERALGRRQMRVGQVGDAEYRQVRVADCGHKPAKLVINRHGFQEVLAH
jgi:hypothetical protein